MEPNFSHGLIEKLGIQTEELTAKRSVLTMPVEGNTQPFGLLHGGASAALAESAASLAAYEHGKTIGCTAVGTEVSISHLRGIRSGVVRATATAEHLGRSSTVHLVRIRDEDDNLIATALVTNCLLENK